MHNVHKNALYVQNSTCSLHSCIQYIKSYTYTTVFYMHNNPIQYTIIHTICITKHNTMHNNTLYAQQCTSLCIANNGQALDSLEQLLPSPTQTPDFAGSKDVYIYAYMCIYIYFIKDAYVIYIYIYKYM